MYYKLDENKIVIHGTPEECEKILINANNEKIVKQEYVGNKFISTVFLVIDHNFTLRGDPIVFETMVFTENDHQELYCRRYRSWQEAEEGHERAVEWVKNGCKEDE